MINKVINIDVDYNAMGIKPSPRKTTLTTYILDDRNITESLIKKRPAVIVCPGGAYAETCAREAEPIAMAYCAAGFHAFVLDYSVAPAGWPAAIVELSKAIMYVKEIAEENHIDKDGIFVCGFSAGGHLAASLGVHWNHPEVVKLSGAEKEENKPAGVILAYPVTGTVGKTHKWTMDNFAAGREEILSLAVLDRYVKEDCPQMFIWHTFSDKVVPVGGTLALAGALEEHNVKLELHIYPNGNHGLALGNYVTATESLPCLSAVQNWVEMSVRWIKDMK